MAGKIQKSADRAKKTPPSKVVRLGVDPSGGNWDGSPCSYAKSFVEFVYRDERERRR